MLDGKVTCNQETLNVVKAMLNYGAAAQVQFNYKTDTLANASLSDTDKVITDGSFDDYRSNYRLCPNNHIESRNSLHNT